MKKLNWNCYDCEQNTLNEYYMIHDYLWNIITKDKPVDLLCIGCVENRLGRQLYYGDFSICPLNFDWNNRKSKRLRNRLTGYKKYLRDGFKFIKKYL